LLRKGRLWGAASEAGIGSLDGTIGGGSRPVKPVLGIHQRSFHCLTNPVDAAEYLQEGMSHADHVLLDFDHKEIVIGGKRVNPPKLQGVSGGGIFHISRETKQRPLVAIATQNRRNSRLIVGTRIKHFLAMARELKTKP
jgi:hypothetical protein